MTDTVHVLIYGSSSAGVCDYYRLGMYAERLAALGVEMKSWSEFNDHLISVPAAYANRLDDAIRDGVAQPDLTPLDWADVVLFRRWYSVVPCCEDCDTTGSADSVAAHCRATGHSPNVPDRLLPLLLTTFREHPEVLRGRAVVYETDDDLIAGAPWLPYYKRLVPDRPIIEAMMRQADLITVTTPVLAGMAGRFNASVRVVRNAVDPAWYDDAAAPARPAPEAGPRILYYGAAPRLRDYGVCRDAVDAVAAQTPGARRLWLGAAQDPGIRAVVDEAFPYVEGVAAFARALAATRPDIGLAPVVGDDFDRAHSELHWLEYSMVGAATIASRTMGGGPYDVIRDGVDGLLAQTKVEWRDGLCRLAASSGLRADLAGKARERVLAEYTADHRAEEWADAYRWAAEHGGRGVVRGRPAAAAPSGSLAHRQRARRESAAAVALLAKARGTADVCWPKGAAGAPLVSVVVAAGAHGGLLVERAVSSVLAQTYQNFEIVVIGDGTAQESALAALAALRSKDPRIVFENRPLPGADSEATPARSDSRLYNRALELARGTWIAPLSEDAEFTPDHIAILLSAAIDNRLEFVYGQSWTETPDGTWSRVGEWPPGRDSIGACSMIYSAALAPMKRDAESWREGETSDWNLWRRMWQAGVRMGYVPRPVLRQGLVT
jgi:hypothetical protein